MFWIELIIVLAIIFIGVRVGGTFLAMAGGIGMFIMTFILHVTPSDPPITVILIMIAVICAAATMQACGGLDYLVRIAEKILRKNPKMITVLAPVVAYIFTFMCGTGHIVYSLLPVINEIAIETGVRPERPISASIVSSQQAITTSQSSTTMIMIPIGIALGLPANVIVAGWIACSSNYFIPASGQCVAALAFDSAGTTKIGKFVLNHSYMIPGLVCTVVSVVVALLIGAVVF